MHHVFHQPKAQGANWMMHKHSAEYFKVPKKHQSAKGIPKDEIQEGAQHEHEHFNIDALARQTALDHLKEDHHYYTHLESMEKQHMNKEAFERGFMKAALENGVYPLVAIGMLKQAAKELQLQNQGYMPIGKKRQLAPEEKQEIEEAKTKILPKIFTSYKDPISMDFCRRWRSSRRRCWWSRRSNAW
jgi:hypothetical protein